MKAIMGGRLLSAAVKVPRKRTVKNTWIRRRVVINCAYGNGKGVSAMDRRRGRIALLCTHMADQRPE
jgi:hypothetical protein